MGWFVSLHVNKLVVADNIVKIDSQSYCEY